VRALQNSSIVRGAMFRLRGRGRIARSVPRVDETREALWDSLFATVWACRRLVDARNPRLCLRREETRPRVLAGSYFSAVSGVISLRPGAQRSVGVAPSLGGGRLVVYFPDDDLADGAAEVQSRGFFDTYNAPPWDTWVAMVEDGPADRPRPYLVSWVPPELVALAQSGIDVNPERCIRWLADADVVMRDVCADLRPG
jgi:hypothetical protein